MGVVFQGVGSVGEQEGDGDHVEVFEGYFVIFFGLFFSFREGVFVFEGNAVWDE